MTIHQPRDLRDEVRRLREELETADLRQQHALMSLKRRMSRALMAQIGAPLADAGEALSADAPNLDAARRLIAQACDEVSRELYRLTI